jgi:hypothetical protein
MTPSITVCMFVLLTRLRWKKARGGIASQLPIWMDIDQFRGKIGIWR